MDTPIKSTPLSLMLGSASILSAPHTKELKVESPPMMPVAMKIFPPVQ